MTAFRDDVDINALSATLLNNDEPNGVEDVASIVKDSSVKQPSGLIQSVDRAMQIMQLLSEAGTQTVTEISQKLDVHKSTASRLLATLEQHGVVEQYQNRGAYRLGLALVGFTNSVLKDYNILDYARPVCERLGRDTDETVNVAIILGKNVVNIDQVTGSGAIASVNWIGKHTPIHATSSGKSILAFMEPDKREAIVQAELKPFTQHTLVEADKFRAALDTIRKQGFAITIGEFELGLTGIAAPIFNSTGTVEASVSVSAPTFRVQGEMINEIAAKVKQAAEDVSQMLGYRNRTARNSSY